jgi:hypothetical protein
MQKIMPDYSLVRNALPLEHWLWQLLDESQPTRIEAGEVLLAMDYGLPSMHTDWTELAEVPDTESQRLRFVAGVKNALAAPEFDTPLFVEKLGAFRLALANDWRQRVSQSLRITDARDDKYDRLADSLVETIHSSDDETERERAFNRMARLSAVYLSGGCNPEHDTFAGAESMLPSAMASHRVFELLDVELMEVPAVLEALLSDTKRRGDALSALARIGPAAIQFAPLLLSDLDNLLNRGSKPQWFDAAHALGAIGRDNPMIVEAMIDRLTHAEGNVRISAANVLQHMGLSVCNRHKEICGLLLPMLQRDDEFYAAVVALASVGRELSSIRATVLSFAKPRAKKMRVDPHSENREYDHTIWERGTAISAMKYFTLYPEECLPILIEAMQSFEEFDPDECHHGPLGRIATVICQFGTRASAAVLPLAEHLDDEPDEIPVCILQALASIGPAAGPAIPAIQELRKRFSDDMADVDAQIISKIDDLPGWTIQQIRGIYKREE